MFCSKCGNKMGNARFCDKCGADNGVGQVQGAAAATSAMHNSGALSYYVKALQNYSEFSGRARRSEYWYFMLFNLIISFVMGIIDALFGMGGWLSNIYSIAVLLPGIAVSIRRMHDINKSGWYIMIPLYNLILCCTEGGKGANQYGVDPKLTI